jgi:hypothetical protein
VFVCERYLRVVTERSSMGMVWYLVDVDESACDLGACTQLLRVENGVEGRTLRV